ncbi:helix-hairpin-helix domain-containing protein [Virgibacillus halodenitrificans]|uniref:helix-hairpin-helix domain-containing protein n=1 Tax=Virgibacillus halodenitrificans TaxID=1482 RepID=UPI000EF53EA4|nr:helix-hairpin-helix domain-containing protein [Virgibacillus halodenitrificans]
MKKNSFIILFVALAFALMATPVSAATSFKDVSQTNSHYMGISTLVDEGIINGYPTNEYKPSRTITRSQTSALFVKSLKLPLPSDPSTALKNFKDISPNHYYAKQIAATYNAGIFKGRNGYYMDDKPLTREQMATVLVKAYDIKDNGKSVNANLSNVSTSHKENVRLLLQHGISNQIKDFRPGEAVTRGQFATFLYKTIQDKSNKYKEMTAHFIDVGQGDGILIETPNGKNILIDAGRKSAGQKVVDYLAKSGVKSIDLMVATHPDADHIGGLIDVLEQVPVKKVLDSGKTHTSQTYMEYLNLIDQKNIPMTVPNAGDFISLDNDLKIQVLNSTNSSSDNNESSIVLKLTDGKVKYLLTGDAGADNEAWMLPRYDLSAQILKVGHHGSNTSTTQAFVNEVKPEIGILSYGKNNYGHPDSGVVNRLKKAGTGLYSTMESGDISVISNGIAYKANAKQWSGGETEPTPPPKPEPEPDPEPQFPININKADYETLQLINGVGPSIAKNIIDYRNANGPFKTIEELDNVKYIGPATIEEMRPYITL